MGKLYLLTALLVLVADAIAAEKPESFEGVVTATLTRSGAEPTHYTFTRKGNLLRIEAAEKKLEPVNIIDLEAKKLTIVYPHNATFVRVNLPLVVGGADPGHLATPPIPMPGSTPPATTNKVGPSLSPPPGFPTPPPMPSRPPLPGNAAPAMGMPMMPMPPMPPLSQKPQLKKTEQNKRIQGVDCTAYTIDARSEQLELWLTNDSALFPFRLIERDVFAHRFGPGPLEESWPELLRAQSLFPLEATLKMQPESQERFNFKVEKIEKKKVEDEKLFQPPEKFIEIQAPQF